MSGPAVFKLKIQILCGDEIAMGPGKADLLDAIDRTGSISAAGRALAISYRRTWLLVDTMNRCWSAPLVETLAGGRGGGGARVTDEGRRILALYRGLQVAADRAVIVDEFLALRSSLRAEPLPR